MSGLGSLAVTGRGGGVSMAGSADGAAGYAPATSASGRTTAPAHAGGRSTGPGRDSNGDSHAVKGTDGSSSAVGASGGTATAAEQKRGIPPLAHFPNIPWLPDPADVHRPSYLGPTEESNWVLPGRMMVGAYPSAQEDDLNEEILTSLLRLGLQTFVCLQAEYQHHGVSEADWRSGKKLRPYIFDAVEYVDKMDPSEFPDGKRPEGLNFVHFPIVDCDVVADGKVLQLAKDLVQRLVRGENMYVHCWGGHGRTGTVISVMLGIIYDLPASEAMRWCQYFHDMRLCPMGVPSPQTREQQAQVTRILGGVHTRRSMARARAAREARMRSRGDAASRLRGGRHKATHSYGASPYTAAADHDAVGGVGGHRKRVSTSHGSRSRSSGEAARAARAARAATSHGRRRGSGRSRTRRSSNDSVGSGSSGRGSQGARGRHRRSKTAPTTVDTPVASVAGRHVGIAGSRTPAAAARGSVEQAPPLTARAVMEGGGVGRRSELSAADEAAGAAPLTARGPSKADDDATAGKPPLRARNAFDDASVGKSTSGQHPQPPSRRGGPMRRAGSGGRTRKMQKSHDSIDTASSSSAVTTPTASEASAISDATKEPVDDSKVVHSAHGGKRSIVPPVGPHLRQNRKGAMSPGPGISSSVAGSPQKGRAAGGAGLVPSGGGGQRPIKPPVEPRGAPRLS